MDLMSLFVILAFAGMILSYAIIPVLRHRVDKATTPGETSYPNERRAVPSTPPAPRPTPVAVQPRPVAAAPTLIEPLSFKDTYTLLQQAIHLMIVGPTNAGKSTAAMAVLYGRYRAGEKIIILDPHADPETWSGLAVVGAGRDYTAIDEAMLTILDEMSDRYQRKANRDINYPAITVFVDEWPSIQLHCKKSAARFMPEMAQEARKVNMRLVILSQSDQVESLGIQGRGDVRENFTMLLLGTKAITAIKDAAKLERPAAIRRGGQLDAIPAITTAFVAYASAAIDPTCIYNLTPPPAQPFPEEPIEEAISYDPNAVWQAFQRGDDLLKPIRHTSIESHSEAVLDDSISLIPSMKTSVLGDIDGQNTGINISTESPRLLPHDDRSVAIRAMVSAGLSRNKIVGVLGGDRNMVLKHIKVALGEIEILETVSRR